MKKKKEYRKLYHEGMPGTYIKSEQPPEIPIINVWTTKTLTPSHAHTTSMAATHFGPGANAGLGPAGFAHARSLNKANSNSTTLLSSFSTSITNLVYKETSGKRCVFIFTLCS